jgi:hypothetical protein
MNPFVSRVFNSLSVSEDNLYITKISKTDKLKEEIIYYQNISGPLALLFARYISGKYEQETKELLLEYYAYNNLGRKMIFEPYNEIFWLTAYKRINSALSTFSEYTASPSRNNLQKMYLGKTIDEYHKLISKFPFFEELAKLEKIIIDGISYDNFNIIWDKIVAKVTREIDSNSNRTAIHGDFCFSNILYGQLNENLVLKFIDPRGSFGEISIFGDPYYDIAKLLHSCEGAYEYLIYDSFTINNSNPFTLTFSNTNKDKIAELFIDKLSRTFDISRARLIEGLIFIGMCSRHYDSLERQIAMYLTGIKILNRVLK